MSDAFEKWKQEFPRHWWALETMAEGSFRTNLLDRVQTSGKLSQKVMDILWEKADVLERINLGDLQVPKKFDRIAAKGSITKAGETAKQDGRDVYQVDFKADEGWAGRFVVQDIDTIETIATRSTDRLTVIGKVVWVRDFFVIFEDGKVAVSLG